MCIRDSHYGVPISLSNLNTKDKFGVLLKGVIDLSRYILNLLLVRISLLFDSCDVINMESV